LPTESIFAGHLSSQGNLTILEGMFVSSAEKDVMRYIISCGSAFVVSRRCITALMSGTTGGYRLRIATAITTVALSVIGGWAANRFLLLNEAANRGLLRTDIEKTLNDEDDDVQLPYLDSSCKTPESEV
jgi:hypothetical protein